MPDRLARPWQRRYLVVPGIRSSRIYILDTRPHPAAPQVSCQVTMSLVVACLLMQML